MNEIAKGLEQEAQIIKERIPTIVTPEKVKQVSVTLKAFIESHKGWNQNKVAKALGVSGSVISQFISGEYKGDLKKITNKIVNFINSKSRAERALKKENFVQTTVARQIEILIKHTEAFSGEECRAGILIGDSGHGKSKCLEEYARANENSVYVELCEGQTSTQLFAAISKALKIEAWGVYSTVINRLIDSLVNRQMIIMLDEASHLSVRNLNQLRQVIMIKSRCPLIMAGNSDLLRTINLPTTRRGYESLDQFRARLMRVLNLDELAAGRDGGCYTAEDIRKLYEFGGIKLTSDATSVLKKICQTAGSGRMHICSVIMGGLHTSADIYNKGNITADDIRSIVSYLRLPGKDRLPLTTIDIDQMQQEEKIRQTA